VQFCELLPACVIVTVCPAMVIVPTRALPVLAATPRVTVPFPVPVRPVETVIHESLLVALQLHPLLVVTVIVVVPPLPAIAREPGETSITHGAASCVTRSSVSLIWMVPCLTAGSALAATRISTWPLPCPEAGVTSAIQVTLSATVHAHSGCAEIETVVVPPPAATAVVALLIDT
jgi:hypothetical protein